MASITCISIGNLIAAASCMHNRYVESWISTSVAAFGTCSVDVVGCHLLAALLHLGGDLKDGFELLRNLCSLEV